MRRTKEHLLNESNNVAIPSIYPDTSGPVPESLEGSDLHIWRGLGSNQSLGFEGPRPVWSVWVH